MDLILNSSNALNWGVERRLEFIEFRVFWEGGVNRSDIIEVFGVSVPQASKDMTLYQERAPGNIVYDKSAKRYIASPHFSPMLLKLDSDAYLSRMRSLVEGLTTKDESWIARVPSMDIATTPRREIETSVLRSTLAAIREVRSIEILYQSMSRQRPDPVWRRITPHAFGYDGFRWHTRAFCHIDCTFKDFLLPRSLDVRDFGEPGASASLDWCWHETFELHIGPHPGLAPSQQVVVAKDYRMNHGERSMTVRYAMLYYVAKRLGLLGNPEELDTRRQHIIALNRDEMQLALARAESRSPIEDRQADVHAKT